LIAQIERFAADLQEIRVTGLFEASDEGGPHQSTMPSYEDAGFLGEFWHGHLHELWERE
jgi:hypothetical protein